jgi:hypothetical protein
MATDMEVKHNMTIIIYNLFMSAFMLLGLNLRFLPGGFGNNVKNEDPTPRVFLLDASSP